MLEDRTLECRKPFEGAECEGTFVFTAGEQEFFAEKGFTEPQRCKTCRQAAKAARFNRPRRDENSN